MKLIRRGGQAFPIAGDWLGRKPTPEMTLRDYFAANAPEPPSWWWADGCPTPPPGWKEGDGSAAWEDARNAWVIAHLARWKFTYADAMIAQREVFE